MKLIDKAAVVAEIVRRRKEIPKNETDKALRAVYGNEAFVLTELLSFLDTLEVKEVDLNEYINKYFKGWYVDFTDQGNILHTPDGNAGLMSVKEVAKYFFELGLKAQKGEE